MEQRPQRATDPVVRIMLGVVIAGLALLGGFTISAHFTNASLQRNQDTVDNVIAAVCKRYHIDCQPAAPTTTTTTAPPASSAPASHPATAAAPKASSQSTPTSSHSATSTPSAAGSPQGAGTSSSTAPTVPPATTTPTTSPPTTTSTTAPAPMICTPQIAFLPPVCP